MIIRKGVETRILFDSWYKNVVLVLFQAGVTFLSEGNRCFWHDLHGMREPRMKSTTASVLQVNRYFSKPLICMAPKVSFSHSIPPGYPPFSLSLSPKNFPFFCSRNLARSIYVRKAVLLSWLALLLTVCLRAVLAPPPGLHLQPCGHGHGRLFQVRLEPLAASFDSPSLLPPLPARMRFCFPVPC